MESDLEHGQTTVTTVAQCQSIQSLVVSSGQAGSMYMSSLGGGFLEGLGDGAGLVYLVVLQETECVLGRFSSGMTASSLYELPCANQAIVKETKRRAQKQ